jgi:hypothetical protein
MIVATLEYPIPLPVEAVLGPKPIPRVNIESYFQFVWVIRIRGCHDDFYVPTGFIPIRIIFAFNVVIINPHVAAKPSVGFSICIGSMPASSRGRRLNYPNATTKGE